MKLGGTHEGASVQLRDCFKASQGILVRALSKYLLNVHAWGIIHLRSLLQCLTTLMVNNFFHSSQSKAPQVQLCVVLTRPVLREQRATHASLLSLLRKLQRASRSLLSLLFSGLHKTSDSRVF